MIAPARVHVAAEGFVDELAHELGAEATPLGEGLFATPIERAAAWAQNTWLAPAVIEIGSISDANAIIEYFGSSTKASFNGCNGDCFCSLTPKSAVKF